MGKNKPTLAIEVVSQSSSPAKVAKTSRDFKE
jgi:hypothetical protein